MFPGALAGAHSRPSLDKKHPGACSGDSGSPQRNSSRQRDRVTGEERQDSNESLHSRPQHLGTIALTPSVPVGA